MWIARNKDGEFKLFYEKPSRNEASGFLFKKGKVDHWVCPYFERMKKSTKYGYLYYGAISYYELNQDMKDLTWDDEPVEVMVVSVDEMKETYQKIINYQAELINYHGNAKAES